MGGRFKLNGFGSDLTRQFRVAIYRLASLSFVAPWHLFGKLLMSPC